MFYNLNLQLFAEGGSGAGSEGGTTGDGFSAAAEQAEMGSEGQIPTGEPDNTEESFDSLIKGRYKKDFQEHTQKIINKRFAETKGLKAKVESMQQIIDMVGSKYGIDANDPNALMEAIDADDSYYEDEAIERGLSVKQLKEFKKLERENRSFKEQAEAAESQRRTAEIQEKLKQDELAMQQVFPDFSLQQELQDPEFYDLLQRGIPMEHAYKVLHMDDIVSGAMQYTAQTVANKVTNNIASRGKRPTENGTHNSKGVAMKLDVNSMSRKDREELEKRVARGERIVL